MSEIRDLDLLTGEPITVRLGGTEYKLPADCPIPFVLRTQAVGQTILDEENEAAGEALEQLYNEILTLFRVHQPNLEAVPITPAQLLGFIPAVYGDGVQEAEGPTKPAAGTTSRKRAKSRSTSPASSAPSPSTSAGSPTSGE